jgi:two-component system alkaline phosphatase synthesis response regulator PhoP
MPRKVLVVDDEPELLQLLRYVLEAAGMGVMVATSGRQAIELIKRERPDLILCDVVMPELNGFETVQALRQDPETRHLPILMLSARGQAQDVQRALDAGANGYITKPFSYRELVAEVKRHLPEHAVATP